MKDKDYVALAYMTGILPIKKYGSHSALNMFTEYSMTNPREMAEYFGFTEEEVRRLCERFHRNFEETRAWYDGLKDAVIRMLGRERVQINTGTFSNDMTNFQGKDDVLTLLIHLGYLSYHWPDKTVMIPNKEVSQEYINAISTMDWTEVTTSVEASRKRKRKSFIYCKWKRKGLNTQNICTFQRFVMR